MKQNRKQKNFFGRKTARPLNAEREELLTSYYPQIEIPSDRLTEKGNLDPLALFNLNPDKIIFEIGFGDGERLVHDLTQNPQNAYLGAEPFLNGVGSFLKTLSQLHPDESQNPEKKDWIPDQARDATCEPPKNIRIISDDAIQIAHSLKDECLDLIYILNPDPWPKKRHHKRRIISQDNLDQFARILKPGGILFMTTDVNDLAEWMVSQTSIHPAFTWTATNKHDWQTPPDNWYPTKYERKGAKHSDKKMSYLIFKKKTCNS